MSSTAQRAAWAAALTAYLDQPARRPRRGPGPRAVEVTRADPAGPHVVMPLAQFVRAVDPARHPTLPTPERTPVTLPDVDALARSALPLDCEPSPDQLQAAADLMAELVRRLNHATLNRPVAALPGPGEVEALLRSVETALQRMQQLMAQVGARLDRLDRDRADGGLLAGMAATLLDQAGDLAHMTGNTVHQAADTAADLAREWAE